MSGFCLNNLDVFNNERRNLMSKTALPGHFYAVGVGPGEPDLLTLRAARLIESANVIITPQSSKSGESIALRAVAEFIDGQQVIVNRYPMTRENSKTRQRWRELAQQAEQFCRQGKSVVQITLGDPLIYATSSYLLETLSESLEAEKLHLVPGISAFQMVASRFGRSLTLQEDRLLIMSGADLDAVEEALSNCETLVLFKAASHFEELYVLLKNRDLLASASLVCAGGQGEHEQVVADLSRWDPQPLGYMTTMIIHLGQRSWREANA
jgi:precorrin-2/cobalt-factor-2 C20-methyltransferase